MKIVGSASSVFILQLVDGVTYRLEGTETREFSSASPDEKTKIGKMLIAVISMSGIKALTMRSNSVTSPHELSISFSEPLKEEAYAVFKSKNGMVPADIPAGTRELRLKYSQCEGLSAEYDDCCVGMTGDTACMGLKSVGADIKSSACADDQMLEKIKTLENDILKIAPEETSRLEQLDEYYGSVLNDTVVKLNRMRKEVEAKKHKICEAQSSSAELEAENIRLSKELERCSVELQSKKAVNSSLSDQLDSVSERLRIDKDAVSCLSDTAVGSEDKETIREITEHMAKAERLLEAVVRKKQEELDKQTVRH